MPPDSTGDQMGLWLGLPLCKLLAGTFLGALYAATSSFPRADRSTALAVLHSMLMNRTGRFYVEGALDTLHGEIECVDAGLMWAISRAMCCRDFCKRNIACKGSLLDEEPLQFWGSLGSHFDKP